MTGSSKQAGRDVARRYAAWLVIAVGAIFCLVGAQYGVSKAPGAVLAGVGTGLVSAAAYAKITGLRSELADRLINQGIDDVFENRSRDFSDDDWSQLLQSARTHYRVLGTANHGYLRNQPTADQTEEDLRGAAQRGVSIQVLWLDPRSTQAAIRDSQEQRDTIADTARSIVWFCGVRERMPSSVRGKLEFLLYDDIPSCGITWADEQLVVSHYLAASLNLDSPGLVLRAPALRVGRLRMHVGPVPALTRLYEQHYKQVLASAEELTTEQVEEMRTIEQQRRGQLSEADLRSNRGDGQT